MWRLLLVKSLLSMALATNNYGLEGCYESACMNIKTQPEMDAWKESQATHMNQFVPAAFQGYATKTLDKQYQKNLNLIAQGPKKDQGEVELQSYGKVQSGDYDKYMKQYGYDKNDPCNGDDGCRNAKNQKELDAWKEAQTKHMKSFVPAEFQDYVSKGLDEKYGKRLNLIENSPTKDPADVQDVKSSHGGHDKYDKESTSGLESANFLSQRAQEAGSTSSMLMDIKVGAVCFAWSAGAWVLLVVLFAKFRKESHLSMPARAPGPELENYTTIES